MTLAQTDANVILGTLAHMSPEQAQGRRVVAPPRETIPLARAGVLASLAIDPSLPDAHSLLGLTATFFKYDWGEAAHCFRAALASQPVQPRVRWSCGLYLSTIGRTTESVAELERALRDDPLHLLCRGHLAGILHGAGRQAEAQGLIERVLEIDPTYGVGHWYQSVFQAVGGMAAEALRSAETAYALRPWDAMTIGVLAGTVANVDGARATVLLSSLDRTVGTAAGRAIYHLVRGEDALFAESIRTSIEERDSRVPIFLPYVRTTHAWSTLAPLMNLPPIT